MWNPKQSNLCQPCEDTSGLLAGHLSPMSFSFRRGRGCFCFVLLRFIWGEGCIFFPWKGKGTDFGIFYHRFLLLNQQNRPHLKSLCPPQRWLRHRRLLTVFSGFCPLLGYHYYVGTCGDSMNSAAPEGTGSVWTRRRDILTGGPAPLFPAPPFTSLSFSLLFHFGVWVLALVLVLQFFTCWHISCIVIFCPEFTNVSTWVILFFSCFPSEMI